MSNTTVYFVASIIGALARVVLKGVWTWKSFIIGLTSIIVAVPVATLIVHYILGVDSPPALIGSVYTLCGVLAAQIFERIDHVHISVKVGGVEIDSDVTKTEVPDPRKGKRK